MLNEKRNSLEQVIALRDLVLNSQLGHGFHPSEDGPPIKRPER
jgi:hypothetical protein